MIPPFIRMRPKRFVIVAVDGGAASGKSSTSRGVASRCEFMHVDTGSHYRAVCLACLDAGVPADGGERLDQFLKKLELSASIECNQARIQINGRVPDENRLRSGAVNSEVSRYAALPSVRETVKSYQRDQVELARSRGFGGIIMEGRDIGTVILPDADLKVFLEADAATREARRREEGREDQIAARDKQDQSRKTAPLQAAGDALHIDNSKLSLEQVIERVVEAVQHCA